MRNWTIQFVFLIFVKCVFCERCNTTAPDDLTSIELTVNEDVNFILHNTSNLSDYTLTVTYTWEVDPKGAVFDGFLYYFQDRDHAMHSHFSAIPRNKPLFSTPIKKKVITCDNIDSILWTVDAVGNPTNCTLPCSEHLSAPCTENKLCNKLKNGYISLPKDARSLVMPAKFARIYDLNLLVYRGWYIGSDHAFDGEREAKYCKEEHLENYQIEKQKVEAFCEKEQTIARMSLSTGPPSRFDKIEVTRDLTTNRARVTFRWQAPHDIAKGAHLTEFFVNIDGGAESQSDLKVPNDPEVRDGYFYSYEVKDVVPGIQHWIKITPQVTYEVGECILGCSASGTPLKEVYFVPDIDACIGDNGTSPYCDINASCIDLPSSMETSAICTCHPGYIGNGIDTYWEGGTGCSDYNPCQNPDPANYTCDHNAICTDLSPPHIEQSCSCPNQYVGDGYKSGSGCTKISLLIALSIAIPLIVLTVILMFVAAYRFRKAKKIAIERTFSKFLASKDNHLSQIAITLPGNAGNNGNPVIPTSFEGTFGAHWELDKNDIRLKGVIGRGNFGVVHEATLNTNGEEKTVAVKMLSEHHSEHQKDEFLAEISLISNLGSHQNLMGMIGCCTKNDSSVYLVSEFMKYGDLLHFLWDARELEIRAQDPAYDLTESSMHQIGRQVASGMKYLTDNKIIHGDLAARNILVGEDLSCKISDFGLANDVYRYGMIKEATERRVPFKWVSPERMMAGTVPITWRSDVWSFGILLYECITLGASPYPNMPRGRIFHSLKSGHRMERPVSCSEHMYDIMIRCWEWTPSKRPSFKQLEDIMEIQISKNQQYSNLANIVTTLDVDTYNTGVVDNVNECRLDIPFIAVESNENSVLSNGNETSSFISDFNSSAPQHQN